MALEIVLFLLGLVSGAYMASIWIHDRLDNVFKMEVALLDECRPHLRAKASLTDLESDLLGKISDYFKGH